MSTARSGAFPVTPQPSQPPAATRPDRARSPSGRRLREHRLGAALPCPGGCRSARRRQCSARCSRAGARRGVDCRRRRLRRRRRCPAGWRGRSGLRRLRRGSHASRPRRRALSSLSGIPATSRTPWPSRPRESGSRRPGAFLPALPRSRSRRREPPTRHRRRQPPPASGRRSSCISPGSVTFTKAMNIPAMGSS